MPEMGVLTITVAWLIFLFPITLFGAVLYPSRKVAPELNEKGNHTHRTFYVETEKFHDVDSYMTAIHASDPNEEIAYEILRTAGLREIKRRRFLRALWAAATSFIALYFGQLLRAEGLFPI